MSSSSHHGRQRTIPLEGLYHLAQDGLSSQRLPQHLMVSSLSGQSSECWLVLGRHPTKQLPCLMQSVGLRKIVTEELSSIIEISCIITGIPAEVQLGQGQHQRCADPGGQQASANCSLRNAQQIASESVIPRLRDLAACTATQQRCSASFRRVPNSARRKSLSHMLSSSHPRPHSPQRQLAKATARSWAQGRLCCSCSAPLDL